MENRKKLQALIYIVLFLIMVVCAICLIPEAAEYYNSAKAYRRLRQESMITPEKPDIVSTQEAEKYPVINWELFRGMDIAAWLIFAMS